MKKLYLITLIFINCISISYSQVQTFKYQAVLRDKDNNLLPDKNVGLKVSIIQGIEPAVYTEEYNKTSDDFGIINLEIGTGTVLSGNYLTIDWSKENNQLKIEIDINGGRTYSLLGTSPILSVPIANYAVKSSFPAGMIMAFAGDTSSIPDGWLLCDSSEVSRTTYAELFKAIGISWGEGDQKNTFNLPDLRGQFLRGVTLGKSLDPDVSARTPNGEGQTNAPGSIQSDAFQAHDHNVYAVQGGGAQSGDRDSRFSAAPLNFNTGDILSKDGYNDVKYSSETRPTNAYVNYIIKY